MNFSLRSSRFHWAASAAGLAGASLLGGCAPTINLATPEPLKADIAVRLDVYQQNAPGKAKDQQSSIEVAANRRQRADQIQKLKKDGVLGETCDGYLALRGNPADPKDLAYAQGMMNAENADRSFLYLANAQSQDKPLEIIERDYGKLWAQQAFPGEWIQKDDGTWIRK